MCDGYECNQKSGPVAAKAWVGNHGNLNKSFGMILVRGFHPKLVRGARSKMRGSNAEIIWRHARAARQRSAASLKAVYFGCSVEPDASQKRPCMPILAWVTSQQGTTGRGR